MMTTPMEMWRAGFVFWTRAAEAQMEIAQQWFCAWMRWEREAEKAGTQALDAAAKVPFAPNAVSAPRPKAKSRGVSLKPVPDAVKPAAKRPSA